MFRGEARREGGEYLGVPEEESRKIMRGGGMMGHLGFNTQKRR